MKTPLIVVADDTQSIGQRVAALQSQAKNLAGEHVRALIHALEEVSRLSDEISDGGGAYPAGIRELASRLSETSENHAKTISAILARP